MSKFVRIQTELRDVSLIKQALDDLKLSYGENERYTHVWSGFSGQVPLLVRARGATFAFREAQDGIYEAVGDDMQMATVRSHLQAIQQRYAYHKVLAEVENAGFALVEERVGDDRVIRMTVRRWQ
ncbi:MAG: DUF1257 domain-containing protein [Caldilinea sp.]|nr:DUF1257 domain-containing protein [Caldilinea sp.]MCB0137751.1 DUF1257 domain-containing protein [Caldilineaceae bacterium]MCB0039802.1 DUF1257 domain-containing protein [Caldilinea sp.]MCB0050336.1 DUF1257 domain-containing protein [Caldilinea sp.]MCB0148486.1 DUF1257 domain-containing protein [Caldilineaceae bacterium]